MAAAEAKQETLYKDCGARTNFAPPRASMERLRVRDVDGRPMFDVYEPRYHTDSETDAIDPARRKSHDTTKTKRPDTLLALLEQRPALVLGVLFSAVFV